MLESLPTSLLFSAQLQCDEVVERTAIICAEKNSFSQIVSVRLFELHGAWNGNQSDAMETEHKDGLRSTCHNCGIPCSYCRMHKKTSEKSALLDSCFFQVNGKPLRTPLCSEEELEETNGLCPFVVDAFNKLSAMHDFNQCEGLLIHRIQNASNAIQCELNLNGNRELEKSGAIWE